MNWHKRKRVITGLFICGIALLLSLAMSAVVFGIRTESMNSRLADLHRTQETAYAVLQAIVDAETGVRGFAITGNPDYLQPYYSGIDRITHLLPAVGGNPALINAASSKGNKLPALIQEREKVMSDLIKILREKGLEAARATITPGTGKRLMDEIRQTLGDLNARLDSESVASSAAAQSSAVLLSGLLLISLLLATLLSIAQFLLFRREITRRGAVEADLENRHKQIALISQLSDSLHSSNSRDESYAV